MNDGRFVSSRVPSLESLQEMDFTNLEAGDLASQDLAGMRLALGMALSALEYGEVPVGAVVICSGHLVAQAFNLRETLHDPTAHAECLALSLAGRALRTWKLLDCTLYVTLEPCIMCAGAIIQSRLKRVVYGVADIRFGGCDSLYKLTSDIRLNHRTSVTSGVLENECREILSRFFQHHRQTNLSRTRM